MCASMLLVLRMPCTAPSNAAYCCCPFAHFLCRVRGFAGGVLLRTTSCGGMTFLLELVESCRAAAGCCIHFLLSHDTSPTCMGYCYPVLPCLAGQRPHQQRPAAQQVHVPCCCTALEAGRGLIGSSGPGWPYHLEQSDKIGTPGSAFGSVLTGRANRCEHEAAQASCPHMTPPRTSCTARSQQPP